jgi:hypothetical protein
MISSRKYFYERYKGAIAFVIAIIALMVFFAFLIKVIDTGNTLLMVSYVTLFLITFAVYLFIVLYKFT